MIRTIEGFHQDERGDWVADLSCLHGQHVRHQPPFRERPWVVTEQGRAEHVGTGLECTLCDRAEAPDGLTCVRTAGPFDESSIPAGLRSDHRVAERTWARLRVLDGSVRFTMAVASPVDRRLGAGDVQDIPPGVTHSLTVDGPVRVAVDLRVRPV